ncbi:MAG: UDP-N-acetylmuramoyl-L-alanine--D-glutamate ligase [Bacillota bacterium]
MNLENARVLVVGMARSGIAAAKLLLLHGAVPLLNDRQKADAFGTDLDAFLHTPCEFHMGENPVSLLSDCDLVVISPGVPIDAPVVKQAAKQGVPLIGELELAFRLLKGRVAAVTGTNGKTTTVSLLGLLFLNAGYTVHVGGNIGYPLSAIAMISKEDDVVVVEVSSFQLETIQTFRPLAAALLNVTQDHLNRHHTMEAYTALKQRVFENQTQDDLAVINFDDPISREISERIRPKVAYFSRLCPVRCGICLNGQTVVSVQNGMITPICQADDILIPGPHNLENAMAAAAIAVFFGLSPAVIKHTLQTFTGVEHRIETVRTVRGVTYINDSKGTNTASTLKAVQSMKAPSVIILGGYDKHTDFDSLCADIKASPYISHAVLLGQTAQQIAESFKKNEFMDFTFAYSLEDAVRKAGEKAVSGGNVLFSPACASFDMFRDYEHRGAAFKEIVMNLPQD